MADDDRTCRHASVAAGRVLGVRVDDIIGRRVDDVSGVQSQPPLADLWRDTVSGGEKSGTIQVASAQGNVELAYAAKSRILPVRHVLVLSDPEESGRGSSIPSWAKDYALMLLNPDGLIAAWYAGAERIYGFPESEALGQAAMSWLAATPSADVATDLTRCVQEGHYGTERWHRRKDGSRFWANVITLALRDEDKALRGFACLVRDFSERQEHEAKLRRGRTPLSRVALGPSVAGIVSGEFDRILEANDAFLDLVGYSRDCLLSGALSWPELTPPEHAALDELAHEECLRFRACTPYERDLIRKDGTRVSAVVTIAVLNLSPFRWIAFVQDLHEREREKRAGESGDPAAPEEFSEIVGTSASLRRVQRQVQVVAPTDANVLILGETGTGKELVARAIHRLSRRKDHPFVTLNCAAIPTGLLESELFGYERGAFTGALSQKIGRFEMAHGGTLFLDEVGDIPLELQPKLLRALQEKSFERLGGTKTIPIDVRLVAATNRNLSQMMGDKLFRSDLYYRLNVFPVITPPLRDHPEDIPTLAWHFAKKYAAQIGRSIDRIPAETMRALTAWPWPGNVRELENFIERSVILSRGPTLRAPISELQSASAATAGSLTLERLEHDHILRVLKESGGVVSQAANRLGIPRTTLNAMMRKLGISRRDL